MLFGETAPIGYDTRQEPARNEGSKALLHPVAPLAFLREALCLNAKYKKSGSCGELQMTGYAHHAYTLPAGPYYAPPERDDVTIGVLSRLSNALNLAARAHAIPAGLPIYLTEFGVQSKPNKQLGVPLAKQAEYDAIAEHIAYSQPARGGVLAVPAQGRPARRRAGLERARRHVGFQTGLEYVKRRAQAAVLRLAGAADRHQARPRLLAVGPRAPGDRRRRR